MPKRMRRPRQEPPKVWFNPDVVGSRRPGPYPRGNGLGSGSTSAADAAPSAAPTPAPPPPAPRSARRAVVVAPVGPADEKAVERERLLARLISAEGRPAITRAANDFLTAGFTLPDDDQNVYLQLLEHREEGHVVAAIDKLSAIFEHEPPKRFAVLESRLRRLEELADDPATRSAAAALRRRVTGRSDAPNP